jgi:hypothetical protein
MNYTYKISEDVVMGLEVYELQDGKYHFHCTIFGLKDITKTEEHFESKNNEYLKSLRRMKKWVLENHSELLL